MSDANQPQSQLPKDWRIGTVVAIVVNMLVLSWWMTVYGDPKNGPHVTAQSWALAILGGVMVTLGFAAVANFLPFMTKK